MAARLTNTTGTPVVSVTDSGDGREIADIYTLTFVSVTPGVSATVKIAANSPSNPYINQTGVSVNLNASTAYSDLIGGVAIIFDDDAGFTSSWEAEIRVGHSFGALNAFSPDAGTPTDSRRIRVHNTGTDSGQNCKARVIKRVKWKKKTGTVFAVVRSFAVGATEKLSSSTVSPYLFAVSNVSGSGASKTMDLKMDGASVTVINLTTNITATSNGLNVVDFYRITTGNGTDIEFKLSQSAVNSDNANVLVFNARFTQIAEDLSGVPGVFGTSDIDLTESGQSVGTITADGVAFFHARVLVPEGSPEGAASNPYILDVALEGAATAMAGWDA